MSEMDEKKKKCEKKKPEVTKKVDDEPKEGVVAPGVKPHMGIPKAHFVVGVAAPNIFPPTKIFLAENNLIVIIPQEDVDAFMALPENEGNADRVLRKFDEQQSKYKFMEYSLAAKKRRLKSQIPDFQKSIDMIQVLAAQKVKHNELQTQFLLSEQVYMKASIPPTDKVLLWLGANVMLEYELEDALKLLQKNLASAKKSLEIVENDLDFLRDQCTTTEVNRARVFNWEVKRNEKVKS